jgi:hypothetical protein
MMDGTEFDNRLKRVPDCVHIYKIYKFMYLYLQYWPSLKLPTIFNVNRRIAPSELIRVQPPVDGGCFPIQQSRFHRNESPGASGGDVGPAPMAFDGPVDDVALNFKRPLYSRIEETLPA